MTKSQHNHSGSSTGSCTFGPNLVILAWTGDELLCRQAQNGATFDFEVKFDLDLRGQSPPKTIGILPKVFYTYGLLHQGLLHPKAKTGLG